MSERLFTSALGPTACSYLRLKEALGRQFALERSVLEHLDKFLATAAADLTPDTFAQWCHTQRL
jgi:hypothetical protein